MEFNEKNSKILACILATLLSISISFLVYYWDKSMKYSEQMEQQEATMRSVKMQLDNNIRGLIKQIKTIESENRMLDQKVEEAYTLIHLKNKRIHELSSKQKGTDTAKHFFADPQKNPL